MSAAAARRDRLRALAQSLTYPHFATVCSRVTRFSPKCSDTVYQPKFVGKQPELDACDERPHPTCEHDTSEALTVEGQLLIKTWQTEKAGLLKKMTVEFPAMLTD